MNEKNCRTVQKFFILQIQYESLQFNVIVFRIFRI